MKTTPKVARVSIVSLLLLVSSASLFAETEKSEGATVYKVTDTAVVRPMGIGATLAGGIIYLVTWPISKPTGNSEEMYNTFVRNPAKLGFGKRTAQKEEPLVQKEVIKRTQTAKK